jgi:hypothetical protein
MIVPRTTSPDRCSAVPFFTMGSSFGPVATELRHTKTGDANWVANACSAASSIRAGATCTDPSTCQPITLGIPQGAAAGVIAAAAQATFVLPAPIDFIPYQLILGGAATALNVISVQCGLAGPMVFGTAAAPLSGDLFGANVQNEVALKAQIVKVGQSINVTVVNPTLANITFVGSIKGLAA